MCDVHGGTPSPEGHLTVIAITRITNMVPGTVRLFHYPGTRSGFTRVAFFSDGVTPYNREMKIENRRSLRCLGAFGGEGWHWGGIATWGRGCESGCCSPETWKPEKRDL